MLKKVGLILLSSVILFSISGCGNSNNSSDNNFNDNSSNDFNDNSTATPTYNITSIEGIGNTYKFREFNECYVDDLTASIETAYPGKLEVNYTLLMTMKKRFGDNHLACEVKLSVYDSSNVLVGSTDAIIDVNPNETGRTSSVIYIDEVGTDYKIKISES